MRQNEGSVRSADGTAIGFVTQGSGPPLLIVHGGMRSITAWQPLLRALVPAREVTAMDRRGRGRSPDTGTAYSLEAEGAGHRRGRLLPRRAARRPRRRIRPQ